MLLFPAQPKYLSTHVSYNNNTWQTSLQTSPGENRAPSPSASRWPLASHFKGIPCTLEFEW